MMQNDRFFKMLGLAQRAGCIVFGEEPVLTELRKKSAKLVIVAQDASPNTKKKFLDKSKFYGVAHIEQFDRFALGKACGREFAVVLAVKNNGIANKLIEILSCTL